ncbi:MAG: histidinol dehydrogenase [Candidatus Eisenbacteria bacterium]
MSMLLLRHSGALAKARDAVLATRSGALTAADGERRDEVAAILAWVRDEGDAALRSLTARFDGVALDALEVPRARVLAAAERISPAVRLALEAAAEHLGRAHAAQSPSEVRVEVTPGVTVGRRPDPLARVGIYAPGGRAVYPSSVLMAAVPARVAGVGEVVLCTPAERDGDGTPPDLVLAAAAIAGVHRVFALGGAGAIGAMAYGTASVPRVDRIVGPGNAWVTEAKRQVAGLVPIDAPAGPSEVLVIADDRANAAAVARELVAQAEHDPEARAMAVMVGCDATAVLAALAAEAAATPRHELVGAALAAHGGVLVADSLDEAIAFANAYAAEHLVLNVRDPEAALARTRGAGAVFLGESSAVAFGDYASGGNHVLPTAGAARAWSGLSVLEFMRWTSWQRVTPAGAAALAGITATLAEAEGLPAHAASARAWQRPVCA